MSPKQGTLPYPSQFRERRDERVPLGEDQQHLPWEEVTVELTNQLPKDPLGSVSPNGDAESLPDDDADLRGGNFPLADQKVEVVGRKASAVTFYPLDIPT
jgi:hypothetical protein